MRAKGEHRCNHATRMYLHFLGASPIFATLEPIIGRLMTLGKTIGGGADDAEIAASDIYEWGPGGFFVLHSAYGVMGEMGVGGIEMIGLDAPVES